MGRHLSGASVRLPSVSDRSALSRQRDRTKIPLDYTWNTSDLYASLDAWKAAKEALVGRILLLGNYRGQLASRPAMLLECFAAISEVSKEYARLSIYASLNSDIDTRDSAFLALTQEMGQIGSDLSAAVAYVRPEILAMGRPRVEEFLAAEPLLAPYAHDLDDILRRKDHTGTEGEEKILADAGLMADAPDSIYGIFSNADFPFPTVTLQDGTTVTLDKAAFSFHRAERVREDRRKVFASYFGKLQEFRRTFGAQLYAQVKRDLFYMRSRRYRSCLHSALDGDNIPEEVYHSLIENVRLHLPTFHRYLNLRRSMLGVEQLHYYDLYAPLVAELELEYDYEQAREHVLASLAPLGEEYVAHARRAFSERWIDVYPSEGKRSGAYSNGAAYDVHPYILLNYNGRYDDVGTLTHELGHTMHSFLSNAAQPYPLSHYSIFVAEVASTFNEALLLEHMLREIRDDRVRLSLLGNYLDNIRATVFRQTQFAEFELRIHEMAERGETLTGDGLNKLYGEIARRFYGHDAGVCIVDNEVEVEWAHIPHFYYTFYVYQYATSFTASAAISEKVIAGDAEARRSYIELLSSGGSDYPIALLRKGGLDMTSPEPFALTMRKMNRVMDLMEGIIGGSGR